jgi:hypothetical protein
MPNLNENTIAPTTSYEGIPAKGLCRLFSGRLETAGGGARTLDHKVKSLALYQLSYPGHRFLDGQCAGSQLFIIYYSNILAGSTCGLRSRFTVN